MRVLYVNDALAIWGGLERVLVDKMNGLSRLPGFEVCLLTANQGEHPFPFPLDPQVMFKDLNINFHQRYRYRGIRRIWMQHQLVRLFRKRLLDQLKTIHPDVIVCARPELVSSIVKVKGQIPLVFESHTTRYGYRYEGMKPWTKMSAVVGRRSVKHADMIVALTEGDAADWRKFCPHVCVIPNIVHLNNSGLYSSCQSRTALFVGRFSRQKDIGSLIRVWTIVHQRHPDWLLHLYCGYGEEQNALLRQIEQAGCGMVVHEPVSELSEQYRNASMLLLSSVYEPFGLVLPEAMSFGLPVLAFDCPFGPSDIISDGVDGFLVKNRDETDYANKVCMLIEQEELRLKMGRAGIRSSQRYAAARILPMWEALFERLAKKD